MKSSSQSTACLPPEEPWPEKDVESVSACPICNSPERSVLHHGLRDKVFFCAPGVWKLFECAACGTGYLDPRPTRESIGRAYQRYFTHESKRKDAKDLSLLRRVRRALSNGYRNHQYGTREQPASRFGVVAAMVLTSQRAILDAGMRNLPRAHPGARLLDVGCGNGEFLMHARSAGWDVMGIDLDPNAVSTARSHGLDVRHCDIASIKEADSFDGITLSHVIEHVHDPLDVLRCCYRLLKPGGWIWIETPNLRAQGHGIYQANWLALDAPRHLLLFTPDSLRLALDTVGFIGIEDEPWRPVCAESFAASAAVAAGKDPFSTSLKRGSRWYARKAEQLAKRTSQIREFITVRAKKS